jgi:FkbM family methyltransferase
MVNPKNAKLVGGVWLPEEEMHLVEMMLHNPQGTVFREGKATYQIHKIDACLARLAPGRRRVCVDVGGHVGLWAMWLAPAFRELHAFEPTALHADLFRHNVRADNVTLHEVALGDAPGFCDVKQLGESSGDTYIQPGVGNIEIRTLDSYELSGVDFVKIDVEGFELQVAEGARETLLRNRPMVCVEQKDREESNFGATPKGALEFLLELGMRQRLEVQGDYILDWPR